MKQGPRFKPHPRSAPGDFYVEDGCCLSGGVPHVVAPDLVGWVDTKLRHCFWIKRPKTLEELTRAIAVLRTQELECHRYAGRDPGILKRIAPENCDYPLNPLIPKLTRPHPLHRLKSLLPTTELAASPRYGRG
jgi:hypothetical protein